MLYHVTVGSRTFEVELSPSGIRVDGRPVEVSLEHVYDTPVRSLLVDREAYRLVVRRDGPGRWNLRLRGCELVADVVDERAKAIRDMAGARATPPGPRPIVAPMPGIVVKVEVSEGERVQGGQAIVIVEAMKMENELRADGAGTVTRIHVREGDAVEKGRLLVDLASPQESVE